MKEANNFLNIFFMVAIFILTLILRFYKLGGNPPAIYWDEAAIGVDAYALAETGKDQYGQPWYQAIFPSYGDYKAPFYIWLTAIPVKFLGLSEFSVRFPSAFFGSLTVLLTYFLVKELFSWSKNDPGSKLVLSLLSAFLLAIIPWHFHFSRIGFESNLSLFWFVFCLWLFLKGLRKGFFLVLASFCGAAAVYSYFSARVVLPVFVIFSCLIFFKKIWQKKFWFLIAMISSIVLLIPLFKSPLYALSQQFRLSTKNILTDQEPIIYSSKLVEQDNLSFLGRLFHHRYFYLGREFLINYFSHFSFQFLFLGGDENLRHHSGFGGELYLVLILPFLTGIYFLLKRHDKATFFIFAWLFSAPMAAAISYEVPHSSRAIYMIIPLVIITAFGIISACHLISKKLRLLLFIFYFLVLTFNIFSYMHDYFVHYPQRGCRFWQDGYKQLMVYLKNKTNEYEEIYITDTYRLPYLYYIFYLKPQVEKIQLFQEERLKLSGLFSGEPEKIDNVFFKLKQEVDLEKKTLYITSSPEQIKNFQLKDKINFIDDTQAFFIFENAIPT